MRIPILGQAYKHPSQDVNNQRCINLFTMTTGPNGRNGSVLVPTAGLLELLDLTSGPTEIRSLVATDDHVYAVVNSTVYKITVNVSARTASSASLGTLDTSSGYVSAAYSPTQIMWVDGGTTGYIYTFSSGTFEQIDATDSDFTGGDQVVFIDSYFIVNKPDSAQFYFSASNNGLSWDPTHVGTAENKPDEVVGLSVSHGELWVFGKETTEVWYNAGNGSGSPFSNRAGLELQIGCASAFSIAELEDNLIWLDDRGYIVQAGVSTYTRDNNSGYQVNVISTEAITSEIAGYADVSNAVAMTYNDRGHLMYQITFPNNNKTWVYDYTTQIWHERQWYDSTGDARLEYHLGQFHCRFDTLDIVAGIRDGKIYIQDDTYYTDDGEDIRRIMSSPPLYDPDNNGLIEVGAVEVKMETGKAAATGDGSSPEITLRYSNDNGYTWSDHMARSCGLTGEYNLPIRWNRLGTARDWMFELSITEPIKFSIIEAFATVYSEGD